MYPMAMIEGWQWVVLAVVALLLFGGTRLAGLGKSAGRAIREFKEETTTLKKPAQVEGAAEPDGVKSPETTETKSEA